MSVSQACRAAQTATDAAAKPIKEELMTEVPRLLKEAKPKEIPATKAVPTTEGLARYLSKKADIKVEMTIGSSGSSSVHVDKEQRNGGDTTLLSALNKEDEACGKKSDAEGRVSGVLNEAVRKALKKAEKAHK